MITIHNINLVVSSEKTIYLSNGNVAGKIPAGNYIARLNVGQQPGWYSLHETDATFSQVVCPAKVANVYLAIGPDGRVFLEA